MKPVLFNKLKTTYPQFNGLSANHVSKLSYKELKSIAKVLFRDGIINDNYSRMNTKNLQLCVYSGMQNL